MRATFYRTNQYGAPQLAGTVETDGRGVADISPDLVEALLDTVIIEPGTKQQLVPHDGDRYVAALPATFRPPYFYAVVTDEGARPPSALEQKYNPNWPDQPRDEHGRFGETGGSSDQGGGSGSLARAMFTRGGFSIHVGTGHVPEHGWMVSYTGAEKALPSTGFNVEALRQYVSDHMDLLQQPGNYLGGWYDKGERTVYLDVSENVPTRSEAIEKMADREQLGVYNLETEETLTREQAGLPAIQKAAASKLHGMILDPTDIEGSAEAFLAMMKDVDAAT